MLGASLWELSVRASLLAKNAMAPRLFRPQTLSLTPFASRLAPTFIPTGEAAWDQPKHSCYLMVRASSLPLLPYT
ncbi:hypothetical protein DBR18_11390 [Pseudomonas sp. HMWF021]|nr:hypothetical protein DBR18_11390 [Pseudomonas sp. HMWF021]